MSASKLIFAAAMCPHPPVQSVTLCRGELTMHDNAGGREDRPRERSCALKPDAAHAASTKSRARRQGLWPSTMILALVRNSSEWSLLLKGCEVGVEAIGIHGACLQHPRAGGVHLLNDERPSCLAGVDNAVLSLGRTAAS